uniref:Uncharacterized protein n=1 Tax=Heterorhabditis bacteriophora TaxID=37862 RepID=A0A1I7X9Z4_HETBA
MNYTVCSKIITHFVFLLFSVLRRQIDPIFPEVMRKSLRNFQF